MLSEAIKKSIESESWVLGGTNFDTDFHFSTLYLHASLNNNTAGQYLGYSKLAGFYADYVESYFVVVKECRESSQDLIRRALSEPAMLLRTVAEIINRSDTLSAFVQRNEIGDLAAKSITELRNLYVEHNRLQSSLYAAARLTEALDRGILNFSRHLSDYLIEKCGVQPAEAPAVFAELTAPCSASVLMQELTEFDRIVSDVVADLGQVTLLKRWPHRSRLLLKPRFLALLANHARKWGHLDYHGYASRALPSIDKYLERLVRRVCEDPKRLPIAGTAGEAQGGGKVHVTSFSYPNIDPAYRELFNIYPEIGRVKLYRRFSQLRAFYFLDALLAELATRVDIPEGILRLCQPFELLQLIDNDTSGLSEIEERLNGFFCLIEAPQKVLIITGAEAVQLKNILLENCASQNETISMTGQIASIGLARGKVRIVIRADSPAARTFRPGDILASEATDPDLLPLMQAAGAIITQQGGVTSHAAIICRELCKPAILGVTDLLSRLRDGDEVEVDANRGVIRILNPMLDDCGNLIIIRNLGLLPQEIGSKAFNLHKLLLLGFNVPEFVLVSWSRLISQYSENRGILLRLAEVVSNRLSGGDDYSLAVRSSFTSEDSASASLAGYFKSIVSVSREHLPSAIHDFMEANANRARDLAAAGSIIIQKMIQPSVSGVCFTLDPTDRERRLMLIEFERGLNLNVTSGARTPNSVRLDRQTLEITSQSGLGSLQENCSVPNIVRIFLSLVDAYKCELDIEWAVRDRELWLLQVRPITSTLHT